jgi:hypothetical protein
VHMLGRKTVIALGLVASLAGGIVLGTAVVPASSHPESVEEEAPKDIRVVAGSRSLERRVADPGGGLDWGLLVGRSETGRVCLFADRHKDGKVGRVGADGRFTPRPEAPTDSCGDLSPGSRDPALVMANAVDGVLVIHGVAGPRVARVVVGAEELELSRKRAFLTVRRGNPEDLVGHPVTVHLTDGTTVVHPWDGPPVARR